MPTYEYACKSCGEHLEVVQSFKDEALTTCPACAGPLRKVFGSIGISFKGSGFYKTDSRSGSGAAKSTGSSSSSDSSSSSGSDSSGSDSSGTSASKSSASKSSGSDSSASSTSKSSGDSAKAS